MEEVIGCVTANIWSVCLVEGRWNKLRVCHDLAALPSLIHDKRPLIAVARYISSDSRESVFRVLTRTLLVLNDLIDIPNKLDLFWLSPIASMVKDHSQTFVSGLHMLEQNYDYDVSVKIQVRQLEQKWSTICLKFAVSE